MSDPTAILTNIPEHGYTEELLPTDAKEFDKVVTNRRSVRVFTDEKVPEHIVQQVLDWGLLAANSSNLQAREIYWIKDPEKKAQMVKACFNQSTARTAQEIIVVVAKLNSWKQIKQQMVSYFNETKNPHKGIFVYYQKLVPYVYTQGPLSIFGFVKKLFSFFAGFFRPVPREPNSRADMRVWAVKSAALACQNIMMGFSAHGFDTCPMEGYDSARVKKIIGLGCNDEVVMAISVGKRDKRGVYSERIRMPREQFVKIL